MAHIEWGNTDNKIKQIMQSSEYKKKIGDSLTRGEASVIPRAAAFMMQKCLEYAVFEKGYDPNELFAGYVVTDPVRISDDTVRISLVAHGRHVDSLYPEGYPGGYDNLGELLNRGYSAKNRVFKKLDDGRYIYSRQFRTGARYFERAVDLFMSTYASKYYVTKVEVSNSN